MCLGDRVTGAFRNSRDAPESMDEISQETCRSPNSSFLPIHEDSHFLLPELEECEELCFRCGECHTVDWRIAGA